MAIPGSAALEALREQIRVLEGGARVRRTRMPSGVDEVDRLVDGLPSPGILEITGEPGTGRTSLALRLAAGITRQHGMVAWVDTDRCLYPPAAAEMGVDLARLLIVRPPADGSLPEIWAAEQLLRSGCFSLVFAFLGDEPRSKRRGWGHTWSRAAEQGRCTAVTISRRPCRALPADVRLSVGGGELTVLRDRSGRSGMRTVIGATYAVV